MSFWGELKRRNVYKVGVAYAIVAWLFIQAASIIFPHLNLPSWATTFVIVILIIGFPLILLFAWAFEITPEGIKRTKQVPLAESITHLTGQKLNYIVTGLLVLAVGFLLVKDFYFDQQAVKQEVVTKVKEQAPAISDVVKAKKTIAVLPFVNRSSEKDQEYFVDGLSDEIITMLSQISDLQVTSSTSSFTFKGSDRTIQEIAEVLGVAYIIEGSVRKVGNALRITAQLIRTTDDYHLWSEIYDRELKDIFAVQEDIATAVASELKATLGIGKSLKQLGGTDNEKAYEQYLIALGQDDMNRAIELIDAALSLDPNFALAWATKADLYANITMGVPPSQTAATLDAELHAAQKAIELEPNLAEAHIALGHTKTVRGKWIEAEWDYHKALELNPEPKLESRETLYVHYTSVGNLKRALEIIEPMKRNDPLNQVLRNSYILCLGLIGDIQRADEEYEQGKALFGDQWNSWAINTLHFGVEDSASIDLPTIFSPFMDSVKDLLNSPEKGLAELRRLYSNSDNLSGINFAQISSFAAYFGDSEFAMDAMEKAISLQAVNAYSLWFPVMHDFRQTPQFKKLVKKIGLVDYWNEFGWPDICRPLDNGDFECN